jgi:hypothetical protein
MHNKYIDPSGREFYYVNSLGWFENYDVAVEYGFTLHGTLDARDPLPVVKVTNLKDKSPQQLTLF